MPRLLPRDREAAIDEAAEACGMDPLEFRLINYAEREPATGKPYSSKALRECYDEGAKRFGWSGRPLEPRRMRDESGFLVGWGMGTAVFPCPHFPAAARATLRADGTALVEIAGADMGQGAWTALARRRSVCISIRSNSAPAPHTSRMVASLVDRATRQAPGWLCATPAIMRWRSSQTSPSPILPRRYSAPAMSALRCAKDDCIAALMRAGARASSTSFGVPAAPK